ncbi:Uncharacterised protein [Mycobacterium tuberculosis]|nr:Uncharacterised protein [Mycobacterium tuberculosis]
MIVAVQKRVICRSITDLSPAPRPKRDGVWRAYFPGTSNFDRQKSWDDFIDVR